MPYSDTPPQLVMPDCPEGWADSSREEVWDIYVFHCPDFIEDMHTFSHEGRRCAHRNPFGERQHNLCYRCTAGFMYSREDNPYADELQREELRI